jgi:short-subunit dehydrogenase involved in D-alanine esterification of teichoic acids
MTALFTPDLMKQKEAAIINVCSEFESYYMKYFLFISVECPAGGCASETFLCDQAAIHMFSIALRKQLESATKKYLNSFHR